MWYNGGMKVRGFLRNKVWNPIKNNWRWALTLWLVCFFVGSFILALKGDPAFATALLAFATLLLAAFAAWSIDETRKREKRDRKERLLTDIIEWAEEISEISLTPDIPLTSTYVPLMRKQREANELLRYGISMSKVISIETIASEGFKYELLQDVKKVANTLAKFICIRQLKSLGVLPTEEAMPGKAREEIKQEVDEGKKSVDQIWQEYATKLDDTIRDLLIKANVIKASLLK